MHSALFSSLNLNGKLKNCLLTKYSEPHHSPLNISIIQNTKKTDWLNINLHNINTFIEDS